VWREPAARQEAARQEVGGHKVAALSQVLLFTTFAVNHLVTRSVCMSWDYGGVCGIGQCNVLMFSPLDKLCASNAVAIPSVGRRSIAAGINAVIQGSVCC